NFMVINNSHEIFRSLKSNPHFLEHTIKIQKDKIGKLFEKKISEYELQIFLLETHKSYFTILLVDAHKIDVLNIECEAKKEANKILELQSSPNINSIQENYSSMIELKNKMIAEYQRAEIADLCKFPRYVVELKDKHEIKP
ncbi:MAG: hypothetical protein ACTSVU_03405, partial [Promethearchaeota archaeon]